MSTPEQIPPRWPFWLLKRADQAAVASLTLLALLALVAYTWQNGPGGGPSRLIEIDREPRQDAAYIVDINAADWPELAQLPDIGEELARRIVDSRRQRGPYVDHDDLRRVRGIGPKTLERIRPYLRPMPPGETVAGR